jgi:A/G-specific adenine glycosylase
MKASGQNRRVLKQEVTEPLCLSNHPGALAPTASRIRAIQRRLLTWHTTNDRGYPWRKGSATKFQRVIAEVLLQRTRADVVARMFNAFVAKYPSWKSLSRATQSDLEEVLRPLGLWKRRAYSLAALARAMDSNHGRFPKDRHLLEQLPGVGQYVCNAILLFDQGMCQPLLDVNLARVLERLFGPRKLADIRYDPYLQMLSLRVVEHKNPMRVNWAFLDLAALVCTIRSPKCSVCPLRKQCCFASTKKAGLKKGATKVIRS